MIAIYVQRGDFIDYIPDSDIAAGDIVFINSKPYAAKLDIKAGELGALARSGVYDIAKDDAAICHGVPVYWDEDNKCATATGTAGTTPCLGTCVRAAAAGDATVRVLLGW